MTNHEKLIRQEWLDFKNKKLPTESKKTIELSKENIDSVLSKLFG